MQFSHTFHAWPIDLIALSSLGATFLKVPACHHWHLATKLYSKKTWCGPSYLATGLELPKASIGLPMPPHSPNKMVEQPPLPQSALSSRRFSQTPKPVRCANVRRLSPKNNGFILVKGEYGIWGKSIMEDMEDITLDSRYMILAC